MSAPAIARAAVDRGFQVNVVMSASLSTWREARREAASAKRGPAGGRANRRANSSASPATTGVSGCLDAYQRQRRRRVAIAACDRARGAIVRRMRAVCAALLALLAVSCVDLSWK